MTHILKIHLCTTLCWGIQACFPYRGSLNSFIVLSNISNNLLLANFIFLKLISFRQSLVPLLENLKQSDWCMKSILAKHILHCQKVGFSHILHLSLLDLMILFCEMHLISLEALMQTYHKTPFCYTDWKKKSFLLYFSLDILLYIVYIMKKILPLKLYFLYRWLRMCFSFLLLTSLVSF